MRKGAWLANTFVIFAIAMTGVTEIGAQIRTDAHGICVGDADGNSEVTVDELVGAVDNALSGCESIPIDIEFRAVVGSEPFACGNIYHGVGTAATDIIPADFRLYLSAIRLLTEDGREVPLRLVQDGIWQYGDVVLLDFEDKAPPCHTGTVQTNDTVHGFAPPGDYTGIRFVLGVPFALNHADAATAPSPLSLTALFWSWQAGYKFLRIDEALDTVRVHLGSTGCEYGALNRVSHCTRPNRGEVMLTGFDPTTSAIAVDLAALLSDSDLTTNHPDTPPGCMSTVEDSDCEPILRNLGVNFENGMPDPSRQRFFRVE